MLEKLQRSLGPGKKITFFLNISIGGRSLSALMDSGATRTFAGLEGIRVLEASNILPLEVPGKKVLVANGQVEIIRQTSMTPISLGGRTISIETLWMPSLSEPFIIGIDFLRIAGIVVDFFGQTWFYRDQPNKSFSFDPVESIHSIIVCNGLQIPKEDEQRRLKDLLDAHIAPTPEGLPLSRLPAHVINVGDHEPIKQRVRTMSHHKKLVIWSETDVMLTNGVIEPSESDWSSPVVMVKKKDGSLRFCVDYRQVNAVTKKDAYPLPNMAALLDELRQANYISTLDLSKAYWQVELSKDSREISAFTVPGRGLFQFTRMPFGLSNAPASMQRGLDKLLGPEFYPHVFVYLDDIIIVTKTFEDHLDWLRKVLDKLRGANLTINRDKSEFCRAQVKYLGFVINSEGLQVDPEKTSAVRKPVLIFRFRLHCKLMQVVWVSVLS